MTAEISSGKILPTSWNGSPENCCDWECAEAVAILFGKNLSQVPPRSSGTNPRSIKMNPGVETDSPALSANDRVLRILMIEDSEDDCELIRHRLQKCGYKPRIGRVFSEATMREALEQDQWDIVFTDHGLPGFSGLAAVALLREMKLRIPIICITGSLDPLVVRRMLAAGARTCISKDNLSQLCMVVERALQDRPK
jgi:CheY-like chemotaxis protein